MLDAASLRALIRSFAAPLSKLSLIRLDESLVTWDEIISIIVENAAQLRELELAREGNQHARPSQYDFISHFKTLRTIELFAGTLAWDSLQHLGPEIASIGIHENVLAPSELAASLACCKFDRHVSVRLYSFGNDARARATLKVSRLFHLHSLLTPNRLSARRTPKSICNSSIKRHSLDTWKILASVYDWLATSTHDKIV